MLDTNQFVKKMMLGGDARSTRGILSRGKNVYGPGGSNAPNPNGRKLQALAQKRLKGMK